jgi:DNA repair exonuclease SbcCD ATPase subunit
MIKIKELTVKNFMSVGNQTQAVDFGKEHLTLVLGENLDQGGDDSGSRNGTGKTTIVNALSFALFGNALTNIKKDNLINKINNKNMLVTLAFEKDGTEYRVERGRKPSILKFYVNDIEQEEGETDAAQGDSRETQKDIDELLGMSHDMFKHIIALNTYTEPFLSMRAADQREIIEQLLGVTQLSEKADTLKEMIRSTKDAIVQENANIVAIQKSNEKIDLSINSLISRQGMWNQQHEAAMVKIANAIVELESVDIDKEIAIHAELKEYDSRRARSTSLNKEKATLESAISQADRTQKKYLAELESLANKQCHACEQALHDHKHEEMTATASANLEEAQRYATKLLNDLLKIHNEIDEIGEILQRPNTYYDTIEEALKHQNNLKSLENQLELKAVEVDPYQEQIDDLRNTALQEVSWDTINELTVTKEHQEFLLKLLTSKDSFIRKKIIDQNLAYLNNRLTYYLDKLGLPHTVTFLNDLNVEITQLGQDLDFDNLSRGERTRLILSMSLAFRDVWESLYQQVSLLFVDELIDNGLDASGVEGALATLKKIARERKKNVFLISHKDELIGRVNNVLKVIKENGFTSYANDLEVTEADVSA